MSLQTPTTIRAYQRKLLSQGEGCYGRDVVARHQLTGPTAVGLAMKPVGKPCAGNPHARFDERGWETERWPWAPSYRAHPRLYLTARSLHCRDSVRLQSYFHRPDEPVSTPARAPNQTRSIDHAGANASSRLAFRPDHSMKVDYHGVVTSDG
jgi:hypothetical protein